MATARLAYPSPKPGTYAAPPLSPDAALWRRRTWAGAASMLVALICLVAVMFALPTGYNARWWGINPLGVRHWADHLRISLPDALSAARWSVLFRCSLALLWSGYAAMLVCARRGGRLSFAQILGLTASASVALAVFAPPLLATDAYAYAAYARLPVLYGQNPYVVLPYSFLASANDPAQYFLAWNLPTVYGPVWTGATILLVKVLPHGWLWGEVVGMKLIEAAALCLAAWSAGRVAERLCPGQGRWAALAVGLNPLLLLEGPATGHNDVLMTALVLTAAAAFLEQRYSRAGLWLGLAIGVKLLPLVLLPWLAIEVARVIPDIRARWRNVAGMSACTLLPSVAGYACFWHGAATFTALHSRALAGHGTMLWAAAAYAVLTVFLWIRRQPPGFPFTAWAAFSATLMLTGMGFAFPWYIAWFWPALLVQTGRVAMLLSIGAFALSFVWESLYGTLVPLRLLLAH